MNKPENWFAYSQIDCDLYEGGNSNMSPRSSQDYCHRKDRQGKSRPCYDKLKCHWNVCPKLKSQRKAGNFVGWDYDKNEIYSNTPK